MGHCRNTCSPSLVLCPSSFHPFILYPPPFPWLLLSLTVLWQKIGRRPAGARRHFAGASKRLVRVRTSLCTVADGTAAGCNETWGAMVSAPRSSGHPRRQRVHGRAGHVTKSEMLLAEFSFNEIFFVFFLLRGAGVVFTIMRGAGVEPQSPLEIGD